MPTPQEQKERTETLSQGCIVLWVYNNFTLPQLLSIILTTVSSSESYFIYLFLPFLQKKPL